MQEYEALKESFLDIQEFKIDVNSPQCYREQYYAYCSSCSKIETIALDIIDKGAKDRTILSDEKMNDVYAKLNIIMGYKARASEKIEQSDRKYYEIKNKIDYIDAKIFLINENVPLEKQVQTYTAEMELIVKDLEAQIQEIKNSKNELKPIIGSASIKDCLSSAKEKIKSIRNYIQMAEGEVFSLKSIKNAIAQLPNSGYFPFYERLTQLDEHKKKHDWLPMQDRIDLHDLIKEKVSETFTLISAKPIQEQRNAFIEEFEQPDYKALGIQVMLDLLKSKTFSDQEIEKLLPLFRLIVKNKHGYVCSDEENKAALLPFQNPKRGLSNSEIIAWIAIGILALLMIASIVALAAPALGGMLIFAAIAKLVTDLFVAISTFFLGAGVIASISGSAIGGILAVSSGVGACVLATVKGVNFFKEKQHEQDLRRLYDQTQGVYTLSTFQPKN